MSILRVQFYRMASATDNNPRDDHAIKKRMPMLPPSEKNGSLDFRLTGFACCSSTALMAVSNTLKRPNTVGVKQSVVSDNVFNILAYLFQPFLCPSRALQVFICSELRCQRLTLLPADLSSDMHTEFPFLSCTLEGCAAVSLLPLQGPFCAQVGCRRAEMGFQVHGY